MNKLLSTTAIALLLGATAAMAQGPGRVIALAAERAAGAVA